MENVYKESRKHIEIAKSAFRKTKEKKMSKLEDNFLRKKNSVELGLENTSSKSNKTYEAFL